MQWHDYFKNMPNSTTLYPIKWDSRIQRKHGGTRGKKERSRPAILKDYKKQNNCRKCSRCISTTEKISVERLFFHRKCFACEFTNCNTTLTSESCSVYHNEDDTITFLCPYHFVSVDSADSTTGSNTLQCAEKFSDLTTERIASRYFEDNEKSEMESKYRIKSHPSFDCEKDRQFFSSERINSYSANELTHSILPDYSKPIHKTSFKDPKAEDGFITEDVENDDSKFTPHIGQRMIYRSIRDRTRKGIDTGVDSSQVHGKSEDDDDDDSEKIQEENQRQQNAFSRALELDQKMDLLQQEMESVEKKAKNIENKFRNSNNNVEERRYLVEWCNIIEEKNELVRQDRDLSLEFKKYQLEDEHCRVENELRNKRMIDENLQGVESKALLNEKIRIISDMDDLVQIIDQERINENEEDNYRKIILIMD